MSKRRTKKEKKGARHPFTVAWKKRAETASSEASVKGQFQKDKKVQPSGSKTGKNAKYSAKAGNLNEAKRDIIKSLILALLLLGLEVVLYLTWNPS